jgi:opacity protein-like surface antigen
MTAPGYDVDLGNAVLGIEGEISDSSVRAAASDILDDGDELNISTGRDIYVGIRPGVPVSEKMMIFAKGGYTNQRFNAAYTRYRETVSESDNSDGFRLGAGVEFDFGQPFARLEYRFPQTPKRAPNQIFNSAVAVPFLDGRRDLLSCHVGPEHRLGIYLGPHQQNIGGQHQPQLEHHNRRQ